VLGIVVLPLEILQEKIHTGPQSRISRGQCGLDGHFVFMTGKSSVEVEIFSEDPLLHSQPAFKYQEKCFRILQVRRRTRRLKCLKGLSHKIFTLIFWLEWIYLGLNENRYWFLNFKEGFSILDSYFKY
jgi:hypothetical protein